MLDDVTLVLVAGDPDVPHLAGRIRHLQDRGLLTGPTAVVVPAAAVQGVAEACAGLPSVQLLPRHGAESPAEVVSGLIASVPTRYFTLTTPDGSLLGGLDQVAADLHAERQRAGPVTATLSDPVLLWQRTAPVELVTAYIDHVLAGARPGSPVTDYLGHLALRAAKVTVQWLEPAQDAVEIAFRLNLAGHVFADRPPWQFELAVRGGGRVVRSAPARLVERVDATGTARWEWLVTRLPRGLGRGDYRLELSLATPHEPLRRARTARPSNGALAGGLTVGPGSAEQGRSLRYLLHTPSHGGHALLQVGPGSGLLARLDWAARLASLDLGYIVRGEGGRRMRLLRFLRLVTAPLFHGSEIWLLGERAEEAQDNGAHLFRYLRAHHPRRRVYYVLSRSSPQYPELRRLGRVVPHSSWRHQLLMLHAAVLANAHSPHHMLPRTWRRRAFHLRLAWRVGARQVFLQHGVHLSPEAVKRGNTGYSLILTSARRETEALRAVSGYGTQLAEVGLPRFDHLVPSPPSRTVLVMPTWRRYLPSRFSGSGGPGLDPYEGSDYERFMSGLLTSARLHSMLQAHDYRLLFVPHFNMVPHFAGAPTAGERIEVVNRAGTALQALVRSCDAFVTDHSSVHFDAAYLGTPVIYARFDREEFEARHAAPSWFDFGRDGFGPVTTTLEETLDELEALLARRCAPDPRYAGRVAALFTHHDRENCRRAVEAIDSLVHPRHGADRRRPPRSSAATARRGQRS